MNGSSYKSICDLAEFYLYDYAVENDGVPDNISDHIGSCQKCKQRLELLKNAMSESNVPGLSNFKDTAAVIPLLKKHFVYISKPVTCNIVKPFLPSLSDTSLKIKVPTPITVHLDHCKECLKDIETIRCLGLDKKQLDEIALIFSEESSEKRNKILHEKSPDLNNEQNLFKIGEIANRPDSPIVTTYTIKGGSESKEKISDFCRHNINVKVTNSKVAESVDSQFLPKLTFRTIPNKLKTRIKPALAAAAIIIIGIILFNTSQAKAVTIEQVCKAIENIKNVYIAKFEPGQPQPQQELWFFNNTNLYLIQTGKEAILWDFVNRTRKVKQFDGDVTEVNAITKEEMDNIEKKVKSNYLGLMPFYELSQIPDNSTWLRVNTDSLKVSREIEIYDLLWSTKNFDGSHQYWKWRFFIDPETKLPQKTECYLKLIADSDYALKSINIIEYPSDNQVKEILSNFSF